MLSKTFFLIANRSRAGRRIIFRALFEYLARRHQDYAAWTQMNYGYAAEHGRGHTITLDRQNEWERYCHQLYHRVAKGADLIDRHVVEISCGRGGGAAFVHRYFNTRSMIGVDIAHGAIDFCRRVHRAPQLHFVQGDAEDMPLFDESADAIINVEASFCYGDFDRFLAEVNRVLKPGGHFLYADLRGPDEIAGMMAAVRRSGLELIEQEDITRNVLRALLLDAKRRTEIRFANVPWFMRQAMKVFAGAPGTRIPTQLESGELRYLRLVLRKSLAQDATAALATELDSMIPAAA